MDVKKKKKPQTNARQVAVGRRRKRRLRKYTLYYLAFIVFAVAAGVALSLTVFFKIDHIVVNGNTKYAEGDIVATSGIETGQNLFVVDTGGAAAAIEAAYPYIESARVRRSFPTGVHIDITQATPEAVLRYDLGYMLITLEGRVLDVALGEFPEGFTQIIGIDPGHAVPGEFLPESCTEQLVMLGYLTEALGEVPLGDLDLIDLSDRLDIKLLYQNRLIISLGSESDLAYKLKCARTVMEEEMGSNFVGVMGASELPISLRYRDIFTPEVWPFGEELLALYSGRSTVVGAGQDGEENPELDPGETEADNTPEEVSSAPPAASGNTEDEIPFPPGTYTINGEPVGQYEGNLP